MEAEPKANEVGPVVGVVIILLLIIFGGLYFWMTRENTEVNNDSNNVANTKSYDDTSSIQTDLDSTDIDSIDTNI